MGEEKSVRDGLPAAYYRGKKWGGKLLKRKGELFLVYNTQTFSLDVNE